MEPKRDQTQLEKKKWNNKKGITSVKRLFSVILSGVLLCGCLHVSGNVVSSLAQKERPATPISVTSEMVRRHIVELADDD